MTTVLSPAAHSAGVLAHGLHAVAHHIALNRLLVAAVDVYPLRGDGLPVITIRVADVDLPAWEASIVVDRVETETTARRSFEHRVSRLPDSGVVIDLMTSRLLDSPAVPA